MQTETSAELALTRFLNTETMEMVELAGHQLITPQQSRMLRYACRDGALARNSKELRKNDSENATRNAWPEIPWSVEIFCSIMNIFFS